MVIRQTTEGFRVEAPKFRTRHLRRRRCSASHMLLLLIPEVEQEGSMRGHRKQKLVMKASRGAHTVPSRGGRNW
jgi:hypothetical protein